MRIQSGAKLTNIYSNVNLFNILTVIDSNLNIDEQTLKWFNLLDTEENIKSAEYENYNVSVMVLIILFLVSLVILSKL